MAMAAPNTGVETESLLQPVVAEDGARAFLTRVHASFSTNTGMTILISYYVAVVAINTFSVLYGLENRARIHIWWMVCLEVLLALALGFEVGGKFAMHWYSVTSEEKGATFWTWNHIFDSAVCFLSFVSCILVVAQNNNAEEDEEVGYTACRVIRDIVSIVRTLLFLRTMLQLQVQFCCDDKDDEMFGSESSPKPGDHMGAVERGGPVPLSPPMWSRNNLDSPVANTPTGEHSSPGPVPPLCLDSGNSNTANFKKLEGERTLL